MGMFDKLLGIGLTGALLYGITKGIQNINDDKKRKESYCSFEDGISLRDFEQLAILAAKQIKKRHVEVRVNGPLVLGTVKSQSGLSTWSFTIDFNDYGHITGTYWLSSNNEDSTIPTTIAKSMQSFIVQRNRNNPR